MKQRRIPRNEYRAMEKIATAIDEAMNAMTDDELQAVVRGTPKLTVSNCWFLMFDSRDAMAHLADMILHGRAAKAKRAEEEAADVTE